MTRLFPITMQHNNALLAVAMVFLTCTQLWGQEMELRLQFGHKGAVNSIAFHPNGQSLLTGGIDGNAIKWTLAGLEEKRAFKVHPLAGSNPIMHVEFSADGERMLVTQKNKVILLDAAGNKIKQLSLNGMYGQAVLLPQNKGIASITDQEGITFFDLDGEKIGELLAKETITLARSAKGDQLAVLSMQKGLQLIDAVSLEETRSFRPRVSPYYNDIAFDPQGDFVAIGNQFGITIAQLGSGQVVRGPSGITGTIRAISYIENGELLLVAYQSTLEAFNRKGEKVWRKKLTSSIQDIQPSPTNTGLFAVTLDNGTSQLWASQGLPLTTYQGYASPLMDLGISPDGHKLAFANATGDIKIWDLTNNRIISQQHGSSVLSLATSSKGKYFATGGTDNKAIVWDWEGNIISTHQSKVDSQSLAKQGIVDLAFTGSEDFLLTGSKDRLAQFWSVTNSNQKVSEIPPLSDLNSTPSIQAVALSEDGELYFVARAPKPSDMTEALAVWNRQTQYLRSFPTKDAKDLALTKDGTMLLSGGDAGVQLFDVNTGNLTKQIVPTPSLCVAISPDEKWFAGGLNNGRILLYNIEGRFIELTGHTDIITGLAFSPDSQRIFSTSYDGSIRVWNIEKSQNIATLLPHSGNSEEYMVILRNDRYAASMQGEGILNVVIDGKLSPISDFALKYRRPHDAYAELGYMPKPHILAIERAYKRYYAKHQMYAEEAQARVLSPAELTLIPEEFFTITNTPRFPIYATVNDSEYSLSGYNTYINNMPRHKIKGRSLWGRSLEFTEELFLSQGLNRIKVKLTNKKGDQTTKERMVYYQRDNTPAPTLHLFVIGAGKTASSTDTLPYASKDATAMANLLLNQDKQAFGKVIVHQLNSEEVTKENMLAFKQEMEDSFLHDMILFYYSGIGVIDPNRKYYLSTAETDITKPSEKGISLEELEELMYDAPAKHKVMILDMVHESQLLAMSDSLSAKSKLEISTPSETTPPANTLELMPVLFGELQNDVGINILAFSSSKEYAMKPTEWDTSIIPYALNKGLAERAADANSDRITTLQEAIQYLYHSVEELSKGEKRRMTSPNNDFIDILLWK